MMSGIIYKIILPLKNDSSLNIFSLNANNIDIFPGLWIYFYLAKAGGEYLRIFNALSPFSRTRALG